MARPISLVLNRLAQRLTLRRWSRLADRAGGLVPDDLRALRQSARQLRRHLDRVIRVADDRLSFPALLAQNAGEDAPWRPDVWRGPLARPGQAGCSAQTPVCPGVTLYHDCALGNVTWRQTRIQRLTDLAPYGLQMDVFRFQGSFLSLVIDLPAESVVGLTRRHLLRLDLMLDLERSAGIYARLNVQQGPNVEPMIRHLPLPEGPARSHGTQVDFDLAHARLEDRPIAKIWLDLIVQRPAMNQITLRDLVLSRRLRADL